MLVNDCQNTPGKYFSMIRERIRPQVYDWRPGERGGSGKDGGKSIRCLQTIRASFVIGNRIHGPASQGIRNGSSSSIKFWTL